MEKLERAEAKIALLNERINAQALEIEHLTGKVQILEHSECALKIENQRLLNELDRLKRGREALDFENQAQALKIAELTGQITQVTAQPAALPVTPLTPGGTP
ncbi:hypothetical protein [Deinococcus altitudinis]|uniref:hypothetical protein n=1 Tax=Deinococcus altitudinis TaxID=468914 RepID=UPI0038913642